MQDILLMHVVEGHQNLFKDVACIAFREAPAIIPCLVVHFHQVSVLNQLHDNVHVFFVHVKLQHVHNVRMIKRLEH